MMKKLFCFMMGASLFVAACSKDEPEEPQKMTLDVSSVELNFKVEGGEQSFTVTSNGEWTIEQEKGSEWCTVEPVSGNGDKEVLVKAEAYEGMEDRSTNLTVKAGDLKKVVVVKQLQKNVIQIVSDKKVEIEATGGPITVKVESNIEHEVQIPEDFQAWITRSEGSKALTEMTYNFVVAEYGETEVRNGYIVFSAENVTDTLFIVQSAKEEEVIENLIETVNGVTFEMVFVKAGTFKMGAYGDEPYPQESEKPAHHVTLSKDYYMGKYEVTQGLWKAVMGTTVEEQFAKGVGSLGSWTNFELVGVGDNYPMYYVSWEEVQEFITKLNELTGKTYALPTEAQWEYAARGGVTAENFVYSGSNTSTEVGWLYDIEDENYESTTHPVGEKQPNRLGIYDMTGNVREWCQDFYMRFYTEEAQTDPVFEEATWAHMCRGGSFYTNETTSCNSSRDFMQSARYANLGFRLILIP